MTRPPIDGAFETRLLELWQAGANAEAARERLSRFRKVSLDGRDALIASLAAEHARVVAERDDLLVKLDEAICALKGATP